MAPRFDQVVSRGDRAGGAFRCFWLLHGKVTAAMNGNVRHVGEAIEALLRAERPVDPARLGDPDTDLAKLTGEPDA